MANKISKIIIAGMPNAGKSTVFNRLTGGNAKVGNWHGVTTTVLEKRAKINNKEFLVCDLPGSYSLTPSTLEEKKAVKEILTAKDLILFVIEAVTLPSAIKIVTELLRRGKKIIVAVNMVKELIKRGGSIDFIKLEKALGCPVAYGEFNTKSGVEKIKTAISNYFTNFNNFNNALNFNAERDIDLSYIYRAPAYVEHFLDKITLNGFLGVVTFLVAVAVTLYLAFGSYGIGVPLSNALSSLTSNLFNIVNSYMLEKGVNEFLREVAVGGVLSALTGIACFLPQTLIIFSALILLEESGYTARLAVLSEKLFSNTGLNGRAVFSIFMGLGCTALSVASSGGLENNSSRKQVTLISAFVPCSAKVPVISYLSSFSNKPFLFALGVYALGVALGILELKISNKLIKGEKRLPLVIELPPYRLPKFKNYLKSLLISAKAFIIRICTVIFIISLAVSLLSNVTPSFKFTNGVYEKSIICAIGNAFSFLTYPIGVSSGKISSAIIAGIFAKEGVLSTLITLYPNGLNIPLASLFALTFFIYAYTPCVASIYAVKVEINKNFAVKFGVFQFLLALISTYLIYFIIVSNIVRVVTVLALAVAVIVKIILKRKR